MELRHIRHFVAVAEELHFARAAERLGMEQSPLSHSIKMLEDEIGVRLLHRTSRRTWLTPAGDKFLGDARRLLGDVKAMVEAARRSTVAKGLTVKVGLAEHAAGEQFARFLLELEHHQPAIRVEPCDLSTSEIVRELSDGRLDLAFVGGPRDVLGLVFRPIWREPVRLIAPLRHPAAERDSVSLKMLREETLVAPDPCLWPGFSAQFDQILARHDVVPKRRIEVKNVSTAASLVAVERGVALICEPLALGLNSVAVVPIEERDAVGQYWVAYRRDYPSADVAPVLAVLDAIAAEEGVAA